MACPERTYEIVKSSSGLSPQVTDRLADSLMDNAIQIHNCQGVALPPAGERRGVPNAGQEGVQLFNWNTILRAYEILTSNANEASDILRSILLVTNKLPSPPPPSTICTPPGTPHFLVIFRISS